MPTLCKLTLLLLLPLAAAACQTPGDDLQDEDLPSDPNWQDLMGNRGATFEPNPAYEFEDVVLTPDRLAEMPLALRQRMDLVHLAVNRAIDKPTLYEGGVFGTVGPAKMFVGPTSEIKDFSRLYWVMIKVLSEKYGCFMVTKTNGPEKTSVKCRDGRQVVFWKSKGPDWIQFFSRQYDKHGYEIVVRKKQIVRISKEPVLY